jgi:hypothetical protein
MYYKLKCGMWVLTIGSKSKEFGKILKFFKKSTNTIYTMAFRH